MTLQYKHKKFWEDFNAYFNSVCGIIWKAVVLILVMTRAY
jgi:hypothetical protein